MPPTCLFPQGLLDADGALAAGFARVRFLVLDEADRVLDTTFEDDLRWGACISSCWAGWVWGSWEVVPDAGRGWAWAQGARPQLSSGGCSGGAGCSLRNGKALVAETKRLTYAVVNELNLYLHCHAPAPLYLASPPLLSPPRRILAVLPHPSKRQTLLFSATMTKSLIALQKAAMTDAHVFQVRGRAQGGGAAEHCGTPILRDIVQ